MRDVSPPNTGRSVEEARARADFYSDQESDLPPAWLAYCIVGVFATILPLILWAIFAMAGV